MSDSASGEILYDAIVVGAGIFGSAAAYHCQKMGLKTILIEQVRFARKIAI